MNEVTHIAILLLLGFIGGFLNAVASSGSAVTLPALLYFGISPTVANATNRIPVVVGFLASTYNFYKGKLINWKNTLWLSIPTMLGCVIGVLIAERLKNNNIKTILDVALAISFTLAVTKFKKLTFKRTNEEKPINVYTHLFFLFAGIWGGLIVLDTATFILFILTLNLGMDIIAANAMKSALCTLMTLVSLLLFGINGEVDWTIGIIVSLGSLGGGYVGSKFAISEKSRIWVFRILISTIGFEILTMTYKLLTQ